MGYAGLATAVPGIFFSLFGGVFADRLDLRRLMAGTQIFLAAMALIVTALAGAGVVQPWHVLVIAFFTGSGQAFNNPARQAVFPQLVGREALANAVSLNAMNWQGTRVVAPAVGGIVIAVAGVAFTFFLCALGYLYFAWVAARLDIKREIRRDTSVVAELTEGLSFVLRHSLFFVLIGLNFFNSFFGISLLQLFPVFAKEVLDVGPSGLGLMYSSLGVGSVAGLTVAAYAAASERRGLIILAGAVVYGISLISFSFVSDYLMALGALFFVGATSQVYMNAIQTALQLRVPDRLRGRVMGIYTMTYNMGPLGAVQAGIVAAAFGPPAAVQVGGVAIIGLAVVLALTNPAVRRLGSAVEEDEAPLPQASEAAS